MYYTQSLAHILNSYAHYYQMYTDRHNKIQKVPVEYLKDRGDLEEIHEDKTLNIPDIPEDLCRLRPDIVAWTNNRSKCIIIEVNVPYGKKNWDSDSLADVYSHKKEKYSELVNFLRDRNIEVTFGIVIISSIGAVYKDSIDDINRIIRIKKQAKIAIKRISTCAILGSMKIWLSRSQGPNHNSPPNNDHITDLIIITGPKE